MTREEALYKLLALEPVKKVDLIQVTGWPVDETERTLKTLMDEGRVTYRNGGLGGQGRWYHIKEAA